MEEAGSHPEKLSFLDRLAALLTPEPEDRDELLAFLRAAHERDLFDADAFSIIEGALEMSDIRARDIMVPGARMNVLHIDDSVASIVAFAVKTGHSRFPVIGNGRDDVIGILLAKDLLRFFAGKEFCLRDMLRPAIFIPESKPLNVLLREFRLNSNHMAIVVDEYGGVAGLVTIENVLEQIVGEIEDEHDTGVEASGSIVAEKDGRYRVKAMISIDDFNVAFGTGFSDEEVDTVGGLLIRHFGRLPRRGEIAVIEGWRFCVLRADSRRIDLLLAERLPEGADAGLGASDA
ncbi:MAG: CBS domain-containing protein [Azoarcus sp.]|jgi:magnesium and cobalt transporter|nr:CBS domain-containing protein [Azoarcus sp.]